MGCTVSTFGEPTRHFDAYGNELEGGRVRRRGNVVAVPERCPTPNPFNGAKCRRRRCPHCGFGWVKSVEVMVREAFEEYGGAVVLVSLTAPGQGRLPWSCGKVHRRRDGSIAPHSGTKGCRIKDDYADTWAAAAPAQLAKLRDAARLAVKRAGLPVGSLWLDKTWEPQLRGVPHAHVVVGVATAAERAAADKFVAELRRLAGSYGFGKQLDMTAPMTGREASRYLAGYLLGRSGRKGTVRDNLGDPRMPRALVYVSRDLTRRSGVTMRRLRVVRWYLAAKAGRVPVFPAVYGAELVTVCRVAVRLERSQAPPEQRLREHFRTLIEHRPARPVPLGCDLVAA